jgi:hypothetical protein
MNASKALFAFPLLAAACGSDPGFSEVDPSGSEVTLDTPAKIEGFLDGRSLVMEGTGIPTHPNGFLADVNLEQATQCYHRVEMLLSGANFSVKSALGTLNGAPNKGDVGQCDEAATSNELSFSSVSHAVENVQGDAECFDFTVSYAGFSQEGRGAIVEDGTKLQLELYFKDQATGMRCADGPPGSPGLMLNGSAFQGNAVQVYTIAAEP